MNLVRASATYSPDDEDRTRRAISDADRKNRKIGQDVEVAGSERLIMTDDVTSARYSVTIQSGVIVLEAL